jgi:hypothetical protein
VLSLEGGITDGLGNAENRQSIVATFYQHAGLVAVLREVHRVLFRVETSLKKCSERRIAFHNEKTHVFTWGKGEMRETREGLINLMKRVHAVKGNLHQNKKFF